MKHQFKIICKTLAVLVLMTGSAVAAIPQDQTGNNTGTEMPQGLWQAFSEARLLIEPVKDPSKGGRFAGQNPGNKLRFVFDENGVIFKPGHRDGDWTLGMRLESYGTATHQQAYPTRKLHLDGNTVTLDRGEIQEWYINRSNGLEQGFTLASAPQSHASGQEILLTMQLTGDLEARWNTEGQSIAFYNNQADYVFSYDKLVVIDANGQNLPSTMLLAEGRLQLQFDPTGAQWPVTVDPVVSTETKLVRADDNAASGDRFGWSVALQGEDWALDVGDTAVIGAYLDDHSGVAGGSAYVFARIGTGWTLQGKLSAGDAADGDYFGYSVAISGDMVLIGAYGDDDSGTDRGSAYVFHYTNIWSQHAKLTPLNATDTANFGISVAMSGKTALIGASGNDTYGENSGSAHVFVRDGSSWSQQQRLFVEDAPAAGDFFGYSVALSGNTALIGAYGDDEGSIESGSAYVFVRPDTEWLLQERLIDKTAKDGDRFGISVALSVDTALIGAYKDDGDGTDRGAVHVFVHNGNAWSQQQELIAEGAVDLDYFGISVALSGDTALIGAWGDGKFSGSAYVFTLKNGSWLQQQKLTAAVATTKEYFGYSVALSGDMALIGAYGDDDGGADSGSAYVFVRSGNGWSQQQKLTAFLDHYGISVALSGDTALIGAYGDSADSGSAYVFVRSGNGWSQQQKLTAPDAAAADLFGYAVALSGDTALIGAYGDDDGGDASGSAYVFVRSGNGWSQQQKLTASDAAVDDWFGTSVALSGDTALIGVYGDDDGGADSGSAYVFVRYGNGWSQHQKLTASDAAAADLFGISVALSGDTALIGAYMKSTGPNQNGAVYVFTRSGSSWSQQQNLIAPDLWHGDRFGISVALSGDTALIGAYQDDDGGADSGSAYVFVRYGGSWSQQQKLTASDAAAADLFGISVALSGDTALIGAFGDDADSGSAYVFVRSGNGWSQQKKLTASDAAAGDRFGRSVALSGDTTLIGAESANCTAESDCGAAYLYHFACGYGSWLLADRWTMVGIPCDPGTGNTVEDIFGDNLNPSRYYSRWVVYERNEAADAYSQLNLASPMTLAEAYWIISLDATVWDVEGTETPRDITNPNCPSADGCYVIDLTPPGTEQPPRFNMIGHVFSFDSEWEDVRFEVDGTPYSPTGAEAAGFAEKEMWTYNGNGYDSYDDSTPGMEGTLVPQGGIWVAVLNGAAGKTVKLLVPVFNTFGTPPPPPTLP